MVVYNTILNQMTVREHSNVLLPFLVLELSLITVCRSRGKHFRAALLDFQVEQSSVKPPAVLVQGQLGALKSPVRSFWIPHVNPPLKAHLANDLLSSGCDGRSLAAMSRCQKLMLDIFRLPIYQSRVRQRRIYIECVGGTETTVTRRRYLLSSGWEWAAAPQINANEFLNNFRSMLLKFRPTGKQKRNINNKEATLCPPPWRQRTVGSAPSEEMSARRESFGLWAPGRGTKKKKLVGEWESKKKKKP